MPPPFVLYTKDQALKFVANNMAFTGDLLDWISGEISASDSETYVAHLAPIKLQRKIIGPLKRKTRLKFVLRLASDGGRLRFMNLDSNPPDNKPNPPDDKRKKPLSEWRRKRRLDELGEAGIALVVEPSTRASGKVNLTVKAGVNGTVINHANLPRGITGKQIFIWHFRVMDPADMVGWYDPLQLMRTGVEVFFSTLFGRHADYRLMEALTPNSDAHFDFRTEWQPVSDIREEPNEKGTKRGEIWIDYVGDVGDGWNSTYAIAHCLAQPALDIAVDDAPGKESCSTKRGDILIFGGDQVYPIANRLNYKQRLLGPYQSALEACDQPRPHAFAIPGNHDWYDSLVSFTRLFCQQRLFAGWQTDQSRSYFALRLPGHWWIFGTDVQLDSDIDVPQLDYFRKVAKNIEANDRVIIITAEPHWVYAALYKKNDSNYSENNLAFFEKRILPEGVRVFAFIAGDQHHYRRFAAENGTQKITAGGGGAFLHPTHGEEIDRLPGGFEYRESFPSKERSRALSFLNLIFLFRNPLFGVLTGFIYMLTSWTVMVNLSTASTFKTAAKKVLDQLALSPTPVFLVVLLFLGFVLFTDTHSRWYRWIAGPIHGAAHVFGLFFLGWGATYFTINYLGLPFRSFLQLVSAGVMIFAGGWIVGSTILGFYLFVSLNLFKRHSNEAFSALCIEDWKNFLRIRIEDSGDLTIFPIGLRKVPRKWVRREDGKSGPGYQPSRKYAIRPTMIEKPITFTFAGIKAAVSATIANEPPPKNPNGPAGDAASDDNS
jgi:hypothetical protein